MSLITRITRMEMRGFKSFANKTELVFGDGFNCVLGPNGAGKSNVIDALCFVLGKSSVKEMRAEKAANLIYNGGKHKNPAKEAEVSIYFDNSNKVFPMPESEIKITRIIRSKEKETEKDETEIGTHGIYKINNKTKTRQQILDFFSAVKIYPDGYNIILQGDIVRFVEMPPIERRQIIEEISGISIYEEKKNKAMNELKKVDESLNNAEIIMVERKNYLYELKKDRDHALKFRDLDNKIKSNKATMIFNKIEKKKIEQERYEKDIEKEKKQIEQLEKEATDIRIKIELFKKEINEINKEIEKRGEKEQIEIHKEVEQIRVDLAVNKQRINDIENEFSKINERKTQLQKTLNELVEKIKRINVETSNLKKSISQKHQMIVDIENKITAFKKKNQMDTIGDIDKSLEVIDKEADSLQDEIQKLREEQQNLLREKDKIEFLIGNIDAQVNKVLELSKEHKKQVDELRNKQTEFKNTTLELNKILNEDSNISSQLLNAKQKLEKKEEELAKLSAKNISIKEVIGMGVAVQKILEQKNSIKGIHGLVSDLGQVKSEHSVALEVAAGARIKSIVVDDDKVAAQCINYLKDKKLGIATFLPLNKLNPPMIKSELRKTKGQGIIGMAIDLVDYDSKYNRVFNYVFENTLVVKDIEVARRLGIGRFRMVTLDGDLVETTGAMHGGFRQKKEGGGFKEKELTESLSKIDLEVNDLRRLVTTLQGTKEELEEKIIRLRNFKAQLEGEIIKLEKSLHLDSKDLDVSKQEKRILEKELLSIDTKLEKINNDVSLKSKKLAELKIEKQRRRDKINELRNPALLAELNAFEEKKRELKDEVSILEGEIKNNDSEITNILIPERENIQKILKDQEKEISVFDKEKQNLIRKIAEQEKNLKEKEDAEKKFYNQFKELFNKRTKISDQVSKQENILNNKLNDARSIEQKINLISLENAKIKAELATLNEEFNQYRDIEIYRGKAIEQIEKEIAQFEKMVEQIGAVNMKALEIYEAVEKEYEELMKKKETLSKEREDILNMIAEIDGKKKELFMNTFNIITQTFEKIFSALSQKGTAMLKLENEEDPFAGGLNIRVRIIGKKFLDIRGLSGGEKTLTALAFIFAIQEHEPAPFYILDEVDASLDKRNSEKLAQLIKNYSARSQYILISHNDYVINQAETLYGVSMNEHGISKVTTLKL
ncbi:MAG: chromosome segregation protein SMC [Candidatus Woesearchaeota archaeon]